jgi:hypothetical protein
MLYRQRAVQRTGAGVHMRPARVPCPLPFPRRAGARGPCPAQRALPASVARRDVPTRHTTGAARPLRARRAGGWAPRLWRGAQPGAPLLCAHAHPSKPAKQQGAGARLSAPFQGP